MSRPTEPFPWGMGPGPDPKLSATDRDALTRLALLTLTGALITHIARKALR